MITVENLNFTYKGNSSPTLKGLNFTVNKGEILGFLGPSGSGKSTTQKLITKLISGYSGRVEVNGKEISKWTSDYYNFIGVGFELPNHYMKLTALENLQFFSTFYDVPTQDPLQLLEMVGLKQDANKRVESYSKGMKMRLNFVRALLHNPPVLFFDEPTSGLDPTNARLVKDIIKKLKSEGKTIFLTTHNMADADELCDRVAFIAEGEIKAIDAPSNLKLQHSSRRLKVNWRNAEGQLVQNYFPLDSLGTNSEFLSLIQNEQIEAMHSEEATLETIFIQTTGKVLTEAV